MFANISRVFRKLFYARYRRSSKVAQFLHYPYYVTINNEAHVLLGPHDKMTFVLPSDRITSRLLVN